MLSKKEQRRYLEYVLLPESMFGEQASEITMRSDHSCFYQEPTNVNNPRVYNGVECEWRIMGSRLMIIGAADYVIYADLSRSRDNSEITVLSDAEAWTTEKFTRQ